MATYIADRRLYVTADKSEVVEEGDPRAAFLLAGKGGQIAAADVARHDIGWKDGKIIVGARAAAKAAQKAEDKMVAAAENKAAFEKLEEEWTLKTSPEDYLERYPDGPQSDLAARILAAQEESGNGDS